MQNDVTICNLPSFSNKTLELIQGVPKLKHSTIEIKPKQAFSVTSNIHICLMNASPKNTKISDRYTLWIQVAN